MTSRSKRVAIVASRFNHAVTQALVDGAIEVLRKSGVAKDAIETHWVPGAFELPVAAAVVATHQRPAAIIALGCVIKGQTPQYDAIGQAVAQGLTQVAINAKMPVSLGVIIADTLAQARERAGGRMGHRGREAAQAAVEMMQWANHRPTRRPTR